MKMLILSLISLVSISSQAGVENWKCTNLINGNLNKEAFAIAKTIDFEIEVDRETENAKIGGSMTTKASQYYREDEKVNFGTAFYGSQKFKIKRDMLKVSSFDGNYFFCGAGGAGACREWYSMKLNLVDGVGEYLEQFSYRKIAGDIRTSYALKFQCEKN